MKLQTASAPGANPPWLRLAFAAALLAASGFSAFGFLCTFEPNPWWIAWPWRIGYGAVSLGAMAGAARLFRRRRLTTQ